VALAAKLKAQAFEGKYFDRAKPVTVTVAEAWGLYRPTGERDNRSFATDDGRAKHLIRLLGARRVMELTRGDVDAYRNQRLGETTQRGTKPSPATLDRELELLKRVLNYAVACRKVPSNPIADAPLLRVPNVRRSVIDEERFARLYAAADDLLRPILVVAFDTGMREREVLDLSWVQVDLKNGAINLAPQDTKGEEPRLVVMTDRVRSTLESLPRGLPSTPVFRNPETGEAWQDIRRMFDRALNATGMQGLWFHDLRRSFVTKARKAGVPESVVMRMSGHRTRAVFDRYNIVNEDDLRTAVKRLDEARTLLGHTPQNEDPAKQRATV
jgi:integrase